MGSLVNASLTSLTPPPPAAEPAGAVEPGSGGGGGTGVPQDPAQRYMVAHAEYLAVFMRTHHFIMRGDGPLAFDMRHYVAIMAVGRHQCHVLLDFLKEEFLASGGEERWLDGLQHVPKKLSDLNELNKLMAHRPWLIGKTHIERLARGRDNWSLGELLQAITVLAHYHTLSSFVLGCSALDEADRSDAEPETAVDDGGGGGGTDGKDVPAGEDPVCGSPGAVAPVRQLMQKMRTLSEQRQTAGELTAEQKNVIYEAVDAGADSAELPAPRPPRQHDHLTRFVEDGEFAYEDFSRRGGGSSVPTFRVQDYSWEDHGFSLVNRLYSDVGVLLDDKFRTAYHLTYQTMGAYRAVDTRLFRRAVWRYIQCLYGIRHDDYDYAVVNQLLDRRLKAFVKTMCVYPERLSTSTSSTSSSTPSSSGGTGTSSGGTTASGTTASGTTPSEPLQAGVMQGFQRSEKVHVAILCLEARLQSELLYALRAVMRYTT